MSALPPTIIYSRRRSQPPHVYNTAENARGVTCVCARARAHTNHAYRTRGFSLSKKKKNTPPPTTSRPCRINGINENAQPVHNTKISSSSSFFPCPRVVSEIFDEGGWEGRKKIYIYERILPSVSLPFPGIRTRRVGRTDNIVLDAFKRGFFSRSDGRREGE